MNREAKIKFLKDVEAGNIKISKLKEQKFRMEFNSESQKWQSFINDNEVDSKDISIEIDKQIENGNERPYILVTVDGVSLEDIDQKRKENHIQREKEKNQ